MYLSASCRYHPSSMKSIRHTFLFLEICDTAAIVLKRRFNWGCVGEVFLTSATPAAVCVTVNCPSSGKSKIFGQRRLHFLHPHTHLCCTSSRNSYVRLNIQA